MKNQLLILFRYWMKKIFKYRNERDNTKNVFIIHSYNGDTEYSFAPSIEKLCKDNNINYYFPKFPIRTEATYEKWEDILNSYKERGILNSDSIIISHSLGTQFIPKYLAKNNIKINIYISVAGSTKYNVREDMVETMNSFHIDDSEYNKCKVLVNCIYSVYSDNDETSPIDRLEEYADKLSAKKIVIKNGGHFNPRSNISEIKEINNIIL